ncbi:MAG TPA: 23S rRNA (adenine(2503)-C(2))-methyltransferase RlmN [Rhodospirillaceae bacterium]|nr:23S rRNA (adenine(2503)-C(2))-methyltransferase RlmN [Rhodospirillaceae bacterium]HAT35020.1 23S rRNA (adenine(2503)-C(2))-methyltransferase RlmN [Rhodospirillaceae bacterium]
MATPAPNLADFTRAPEPTGGLPSLVGLDRSELAEVLAPLGVKPYRAQQIFRWIYNHGVTDFGAMSNLSKDLRADLATRFSLARPKVSQHQKSEDGTQKWLLRFDDAQEAECVHIPEADRGTLCVSSQVGCTLTCSFCHTGTQRLVRNLEPAEILSQLMLARDSFSEWPTPQLDRKVSNIVMMGMGEPLYNFENVKKALLIAIDHEGLSISKRKITLSTSGVVPMIERVGREIGVQLAISLHAVRDDLRDELVPINKKWPIDELLEACRNYPGGRNARRVTFEYVMLKGINDSPAEARELVRLLRDIPSKVNLIPFNPWPSAAYECSSESAIHNFNEIVNGAGITARVRRPRGRDILAACGQLKSESVRLKRAQGVSRRLQ